MEAMSFEEVIRHLRSGALLLRFAIDTGAFPDALLHTFACDCAQRSLMWERATAVDSPTACWKATGIKRLWIEEKKTNKELLGVHKEARKVAEETDSSAAWAATWASSDIPMLAARCAAHYGSAAAKPKGQEHPKSYDWNLEKLWQVERLIWLSAIWSECGERAPAMLREGSLPIAEHPDVQISFGLPEGA